MLKFRVGKFSYNSICTNIFQDEIYRFKNVVRFIRKEQGSMEEFGRDCCIRGYHDVYGYHVYKKIWREAIGE